MVDVDLRAAWTVLETAASKAEPETVQVSPTGVAIGAGEILAGVDIFGHRHLLIPLLPGEAFAEDRSGGGVQLRRVDVGGEAHAGLVCLLPDLNPIFERLAREILGEATTGPATPARAAATVLVKWKRLLADAAHKGVLGDEQLIGLLAELLCLQEILTRDPALRVSVWKGPDKLQHDFVSGEAAIEVKATIAREGRLVQISSVDQLDPTPSSSLHLALHRFAPGQGHGALTLPGLIKSLVDLGPEARALDAKLEAAGYNRVHDEEYERRPFRLLERRVYDTLPETFPKITRQSFPAGDLPPGTLRLRYTIDLTDEPFAPLTVEQTKLLWASMAEAP